MIGSLQNIEAVVLKYTSDQAINFEFKHNYIYAAALFNCCSICCAYNQYIS